MDRVCEALRLEAELAEWAANNARRDELVRAAYRAGVSKHRIHIITGLARTTIDRIIEAPPALV